MALLSSTRMYPGRRVSLDLDRVRFPDGSAGTVEMVRHPGAAAVIPFLDDPASEDPRVLLIHQFRHAADGMLWEIPAGTLDGDEAPEGCARRELREEAGVAADTMRHLTSILTTPGFSDEVIHLYAATGLRRVPAAPERDEFIETRELVWSDVGRMVAAGEIRDAKSLVALLYVQAFLRGGPGAASPGH